MRENRTPGSARGLVVNSESCLDDMKKHLGRFSSSEKRVVGWVWIEIRDIDSQIDRIVSVTSSIAEKHQADCRMFGSQIFITFETMPCAHSEESKPPALVDDLSGELGSIAKILYGSVVARRAYWSDGTGITRPLPQWVTAVRHDVGWLDWGDVVMFEGNNA